MDEYGLCQRDSGYAETQQDGVSSVSDTTNGEQESLETENFLHFRARPGIHLLQGQITDAILNYDLKLDNCYLVGLL